MCSVLLTASNKELLKAQLASGTIESLNSLEGMIIGFATRV